MKESGSGISWKGKKERNKQHNFIYVKFIYSVTCCWITVALYPHIHPTFYILHHFYLWPRFRSRYTMWSVSIFVLQHGFRNWYERGKILWLNYPLYKNSCVKLCSDIKTHIYYKLSFKLLTLERSLFLWAREKHVALC